MGLDAAIDLVGSSRVHGKQAIRNANGRGESSSGTNRRAVLQALTGDLLSRRGVYLSVEYRG